MRFEEGMRYWNYWEDPLGTEHRHIGTYIRVFSPEARVGRSCLYQTIDLPPGMYPLRFGASICFFRYRCVKVRGALPTPLTVKIWDGAFDIGNPALWERTWRENSCEDGTFHWVGIVDHLTITNSEPQITLGFVFEDERSDEWFAWYVDNVSLHIEAPPAEVLPPARRIWPWILAPIVAGSTKLAVAEER